MSGSDDGNKYLIAWLQVRGSRQRVDLLHEARSTIATGGITSTRPTSTLMQHHDQHRLGERRPARQGSPGVGFNSHERLSDGSAQSGLDLYVYGPTQTQYSVSWDNSYKVVDLTAAASGNFQIKVKNYRLDGFNEYFAVAWSLT
jgi:hypothetical protein